MKALWIVNILLPEAGDFFSGGKSFSGGWLTGAKLAIEKENVIVDVAFPNKEEKSVKNGNTTFYSFRHHDGSIEYAKQIINESKPDIVHIFGTEKDHSSDFLAAAQQLGVASVVSIQGIVHEIAKCVTVEIPKRVIYGMTLRNIIMRDNVYGIKRELEKRGKKETELIKKVNDIIGRTAWDHAYVKSVNPSLNYYHNNETLRSSFYHDQWSYEKCEKNTILISQISSPAKGFHVFIDAIDIVRRSIQDVKIYVAGKDIVSNESVFEKLNKTYYMRYCAKKIQKKGLAKNFVFLGSVSEEEMKKTFLKVNAFVMPSFCENSSNSISEAMILGVPCVASYVGGNPSLIDDDETGLLYQEKAYYLLADKMLNLLCNREIQENISHKSRTIALERHHPERNAKELKKIYDRVINKIEKAD